MSGFNWAILTYFVLKILSPEFIPVDYTNQSELTLSIIGLILILIGLRNLFTTEKRLRRIEEITTNDHIGAYFKIILLLSITRLDSFGDIGTIGYITMTLSLLVFCFFVVAREGILARTFVNGVIIGHLVFGYFLFNWSKNTYVRSYGNEIIGSFWEKPNYRTKYLLKVSESSDFSNAYTLQANVRVSTILEESNYPQEDVFGNEYFESYSNKYIIIEKVYWPNGGFLEFEDCNLQESDYCRDKDGKYWHLKIDKKL